jgi:hypothetical protein
LSARLMLRPLRDQRPALDLVEMFQCLLRRRSEAKSGHRSITTALPLAADIRVTDFRFVR